MSQRRFFFAFHRTQRKRARGQMNDTDFFEVCYNRGHHITNPNNAVELKIPQIYNRFALFDSPKMGNLMILVQLPLSLKLATRKHEGEESILFKIHVRLLFQIASSSLSIFSGIKKEQLRVYTIKPSSLQ